MGFQVLAPVARTKSMLVCVCRQQREKREKERQRHTKKCANKASRTNDTETVSDKRWREKESNVWDLRERESTPSLTLTLLSSSSKTHTHTKKQKKKFVCAKQCLWISEFDALSPLLLTDFDVSFHLSYIIILLLLNSETTTTHSTNNQTKKKKN